MTRDDVIALLDTRQRHWNDQDPDGLATSHTDGCTVESPIFGVVTGRDQILKWSRNLFRVFTDWTFKGEAPIVDGDRAVHPFRVHATHSSELFGVAASGRRLEIKGVLIFKFTDGKISHERRLYDFTGMLVQLGVLRAKPGD